MKLSVCIFFALLTIVLANVAKTSPATNPGGQKKQSDDDMKKFDKFKVRYNSSKTRHFYVLFFQAKYGKSYDSKQEESEARKNFIKSLQSIEAHNKKKNVSYQRGTSEHSDLSYKEQQRTRMGAKMPEGKRIKRSQRSLSLGMRQKREGTNSLPESVDYR
jgi:Cathepsin propeptide inhibitor domain (I29)